MAFTINTDELSRLGYAREAVFGTAVADAGAYKELIVPRGVYIEPGVVKSDLDHNRDSRIFHLADAFNDTFSGPVTLKIPEMICTKDRFADMLYACTQNRISQGLTGTGFSKVFALHSAQPDFGANGGYFFTLGWRGPIASQHLKVTSCIVRKMEIDYDKSQASEKALVYLKNIEIIGKKLTTGANFTGVWTPPAIAGSWNSYAFTFSEISSLSETTTPSWLKFNLKLNNGAVPLNKDTDGTPKTWYLNPPRTSMATIEMTHWYNDDEDVRDFLLALTGNTVINAKLQNAVAVDTDGHFQIMWHGIVEGNPKGSDNKQMMTPVKYILGDPADLTSGTLVTPNVYTLVDWKTGDSFTNIDEILSGTTNTDGCIFRASGVTPTTWTNSSVVSGMALTITVCDAIDQGAGA